MAGTSEGNKKGAITRKNKYGKDTHAKAGAKGGAAQTRGYFGKLKDEGRDEELRSIALKGVQKTNQIKLERKAEGDEAGRHTPSVPERQR